MDADEKQFALLFPRVLSPRERVLPMLRETVSTPLEAKKSDTEKERLAKRQANAGVALLRLGQADRVWPLLRHSPDPRARSYLIHRLAPLGGAAGPLVERLEQEQDVSIRRALILALGEYRSEQVSAQLRQRLVRRLLLWYRDEADAGLHGAIDWLLRHAKEGQDDRPLNWGQGKALQQIDEELAGQRRADRGWYVNGQGQTFTVLEGDKPFLMGSPEEEAGRTINEKLHWRRIGRRYAIATKPVTVAEWGRFLQAHPEVKHSSTKQPSPVGDGPVIGVTWYAAAQYCRWLSEQEGMAKHHMVYPSVAEIAKHADGVKPLVLPANHLQRRGYRLPTEAEWEYACRAGARTSRYYGSAKALLPRYAWYLGNAHGRAWPVGQKKPNDFGLFDMHGHVWTWCQESAWAYPEGSKAKPAGDEEDNRGVSDRLLRVLRGPSFGDRPTLVRASVRSFTRPAKPDDAIGLRVARTVR
jgi:formylglycine-generating enzyme required for sulfatase activity